MLRMLRVAVLGLGMLSCIRRAFDLLRRHEGLDLNLQAVPFTPLGIAPRETQRAIASATKSAPRSSEPAPLSRIGGDEASTTSPLPTSASLRTGRSAVASEAWRTTMWPASRRLAAGVK
ncbi:hypothetical protein ACFQX4_03385 [Roseomonas sp. GCM10028921]